MSGTSIPVVNTGNQVADRAHSSIKGRLDKMAGSLQNFKPLADLPATASLTDVIARLNELKNRMQG